jgi:hypothetical protein
MFHLPTVPFLPASLRRRPVAEPAPKPEPWPANPRTYGDDLRASQANEARLSALLVKARQEADVQAARAAAFEQRAERAEAALGLARTQGANLHRDLREVADECDRLETANARLRQQLDKSFGYSEAEIAAIESGTGQPRKA